MLRLQNLHKKIARDLLDFARPFIDFARTPELCKSANKHADAIFGGAPARCPIPRKIMPFYSAEFDRFC